MIATHLPGEDTEKQSALILSAMVGALVLSRSVSDPELADRLRTATRDLLLQQTED